MEEVNRKKYWNEQIKSMMGPCMITFAIPLTIPGVTITLVAYSKDTTFEKYGAMHMVGMLFLAVAIILLIVGCILRVLWKPVLSSDVEIHLSPTPSMRSVRNRGTQNRRIYAGSRPNIDHDNRPSDRTPRSSDHQTDKNDTSGHRNIVPGVSGHINENHGMGGHTDNKCDQSQHETNAVAVNDSAGSLSADNSTGLVEHTPEDNTSQQNPILSQIHTNQLESTTVASNCEPGNLPSPFKNMTVQDNIHGYSPRANRRDSLPKGKSVPVLDPIDGPYVNNRGVYGGRLPELPFDEIQKWRRSKKKKKKQKQKSKGNTNEFTETIDDDDTSAPPVSYPKKLSDCLNNGFESGNSDDGNENGLSHQQRCLIASTESVPRKTRRKKRKRRENVPPKYSGVDETYSSSEPDNYKTQPQDTEENKPFSGLLRNNSSGSTGNNSVDSTLAKYNDKYPLT